MEVDAPEPDRLVLADIAYRGWVATRDSMPAEIRRDGPFRSVAIPAGRSRVEMRYEPASYRVGLFLTSIVVTLAGIWWPMAGVARRPPA